MTDSDKQGNNAFNNKNINNNNNGSTNNNNDNGHSYNRVSNSNMLSMQDDLKISKALYNNRRGYTF